MSAKNLLCIGIGNAFRSDDGAGLVIAKRLREKLSDDVEVIEMSGEGTALMDKWQAYDSVIVFDAVSSGGEVGEIYRFDASKESLPSNFFHYSTHAFSLAEAIELSRSLDQLPKQLKVYGIEGKNFNSGEAISSEVESSMNVIVKEVLELCMNSHSLKT